MQCDSLERDRYLEPVPGKGGEKEVLGEEGVEWVLAQEARGKEACGEVQVDRVPILGTLGTLPPAYENCCPAYLLSPHLQDCFFYSLVFDPVQKTLLADQGEIRVGCKYQAEIPDRLAEGKQQDRVYGYWVV